MSTWSSRKAAKQFLNSSPSSSRTPSSVAYSHTGSDSYRPNVQIAASIAPSDSASQHPASNHPQHSQNYGMQSSYAPIAPQNTMSFLPPPQSQQSSFFPMARNQSSYAPIASTENNPASSSISNKHTLANEWDKQGYVRGNRYPTDSGTQRYNLDGSGWTYSPSPEPQLATTSAVASATKKPRRRRTKDPAIATPAPRSRRSASNQDNEDLYGASPRREMADNTPEMGARRRRSGRTQPVNYTQQLAGYASPASAPAAETGNIASPSALNTRQERSPSPALTIRNAKPQKTSIGDSFQILRIGKKSDKLADGTKSYYAVGYKPDQDVPIPYVSEKDVRLLNKLHEAKTSGNTGFQKLSNRCKQVSRDLYTNFRNNRKVKFSPDNFLEWNNSRVRIK